MAIPLSQLPDDLLYNGQLDVSNPVKQAKYNQLNAAWESSNSVPTFNYDYEGEAQKAYGELGVYYDRLLKESRGDMNKVLTRLTEDYDRGLRTRRENNAFANETYDIATENALRANETNGIARGIYSRSAFDPNGGLGVSDQNREQRLVPIRRNRMATNRNFDRASEEADIVLGRKRVDIPEQQSRDEARLERQRRLESAQIADSRAQRAYNKFLMDNGA